MKKIAKFTNILAALTLVLALAACSKETEEDKTPKELSEVASKVELKNMNNVYFLEFTGDYGIEDAAKADLTTEEELRTYLTTNVPAWITAAGEGLSLPVNITGAGCTSIAANNTGKAGGKIFGRNFDYSNGTAVVVHTKPTDGYESVSTSYPYFLTGSRNWEPTNNVETDAIIVGAIYVPMDGMNTKGLYVSILEAGDKETTAQTEANKNNIQTTVAVRYLLDKANSVDTALTMLAGFNMYSVHGTAYHFALADETGRSVVVEYINNEMKVTETKVVTNHYLTENSGKSAPASDDNSLLRYNNAIKAGNDAEWNMSPVQMKDALKVTGAKQYADENSTHISIWSAIYEPSAKKVSYFFGEDFTKYTEITFGN
ncbi:MAG: linear amide C-N hydrolase [Treponema sp.]|nr:linear amide C-N hydrolase [Treponema sp.]MBR0487513.1 linear amide C-N hydrolase [Treponema sp.]